MSASRGSSGALAAFAEVAASDEEIREGIRTLVWRVLEEAMDVMDYGTPERKLTLISRFSGHLIQALGKDDKDVNAELREDFSTLMREVRGDPSSAGPAAHD